MVLATIFVSLPFVVRETMPVLQEIGDEQEQAAQHARRNGLADLLADHAAVDPLGRRLRRRAGDRARARRVRRGQRRRRAGSRGETETLPLFVENEFTNFNLAGAYAAAIVLALLALAVLLGMNLLQAQGGLDAEAR